MPNHVHVAPDPDALADHAAEHIAAVARRAVAERGRCSIALSGGDTPGGAYSRLVAEDLPWDDIHVFWGDERCIGVEQPDNHYTLASRMLLDHVAIPAGNVHRARGEADDPAAAAREYEEELHRFFGGPAVFDLIVLGMGEDGHIASLFPGSPGLAERERWVVDHDIVKRGVPAHRITLTMPVLTMAREIVVLVSGELKAEMLATVLGEGADVPARELADSGADLRWIADREAASALQGVAL